MGAGRDYLMSQAFDMPRGSAARILSRPIPVVWAGWRTTTADLQRNGWDLAVEFRYNDMMYRLACRHKVLDLMALSDSTQLEHALALLEKYYEDPRGEHLPPFYVNHVATHIQIVRTVWAGAEHYETCPSWVHIDGHPQITQMPVAKIEDLNIFAARDAQKELLVGQADMTVTEHLEAIMKLQEPKQSELRQQMLAQPNNVRKIITLSEVA